MNIKIKKFKDFITKPYVIFILISLIAGTFFCIITPPLWGLDEPSHFARVYQITEGKVLPDTSAENRGGLMPDNFMELANYRTTDILDVVNQNGVLRRKDVTDQSIYKRLGDKKFMKSQHNFLWTASYSPLAYPGAIVGVFISNVLDFNISQTIFTARFVSLILYITLASFAIWLMRKSKLKWLLFIVALIPTAIFQSSTVTADTILFGLSMLFVSLFCRVLLDNKINNKLIYPLALVAILLPLIKINYIFISLTILFLPKNIFKSKLNTLIYKLLIPILIVLLSVGWTCLTAPTNSSTVSQRADQMQVIPNEQILFILHNPVSFIAAFMKSVVLYCDAYYQQVLFTVSGNSIITPTILTIILTLVLLVAAFYAKDELMKIRKHIFILGIGTIVCILTIFAALYIAFCPVGLWLIDGIQGRYFTPLLVIIIMIITVILPISINIKKKNMALIAIATTILCLSVSLAYNYLALY